MEKKPQTLVINNANAEITNTGRFPQTVAEAAVKNVALPVTSKKSPISKDEI